MQTRTCKKCNETKPIEDFTRNESCALGRLHRCKSCTNAWTRAYKRANPEKARAYYKKWLATRPAGYARAITRASHLRRTFGMSTSDYDSLLVEQGGGCGICGGRETRNKHRVLSVDHSHTTGAVRGILCDACNNGLGRFEDSGTRLLDAVAYLEGSRNHTARHAGVSSQLMFC